MTTTLLFSLLSWWTIAQTPVDATQTIPVPAHLTPTIETSVDKNEILIGDVFHLTVTITHDPQVSILRRETGLELGQFVISEINPKDQEKLPDGKIRETIDYQLSTYFTGEFEIPAFDIAYRMENGAAGTLRTSPIKIKVRSLTPEETENLDIRDINEPVVLAGNSRMWIVWSTLLGLVFLLLIGYAIWRYITHRKRAIPAEPPLPPHERAYRDLRILRDDLGWRERRDYEYFSTRISEIIRVYIEERWDVHALDETTEETLAELNRLLLIPEIIRKFGDFFGDCDLMKFARYELPSEELDGLIDRAVNLVDETRVVPVDDGGRNKTSETQTDVANEKPSNEEPSNEEPKAEKEDAPTVSEA